jgi:hypothetical protein
MTSLIRTPFCLNLHSCMSYQTAALSERAYSLLHGHLTYALSRLMDVIWTPGSAAMSLGNYDPVTVAHFYIYDLTSEFYMN